MSAPSSSVGKGGANGTVGLTARSDFSLVRPAIARFIQRTPVLQVLPLPPCHDPVLSTVMHHTASQVGRLTPTPNGLRFPSPYTAIRLVAEKFAFTAAAGCGLRAFVTILLLTLATPALAQCPAGWLPGQGVPRTNDTVFALAGC